MNKGIAIIQTNIKNLSPKGQEIATYILEQPQTVAQGSITTLSEATGASIATISRLCRELGLKGFSDLKYLLSTTDTTQPEANHHLHEELQDTDSLQTVMHSIFQTHISGLQATLQLIDVNNLQQAVEQLASASHIDFWGNGGSAPLALDAYHKFFKTGIPGAYHTDAHFQSMSACIMPQGSAIVAISHSGSNTSLVNLVQMAKDKGIFVVAITSYLNSPLSKIADITLATPTQEVKVQSEATASRLATLAMIDVLSIAVSLRHQDRALGHLRSIREAIAQQRMK